MFGFGVAEKRLLGLPRYALNLTVNGREQPPYNQPDLLHVNTVYCRLLRVLHQQ